MTTGTSMQVEQVAIDNLRPDPANPRRISDAELEALTRSLREWGFVQPVLARREDRVVIGGHQRLVAARKLGLKTVPVIFLDLSVEQARLLNVALNKISGEWDEELLGRLLADLQPVEDVDLTLTGFTEEELAKLLKSLDVRERREKPEAFDVDAALEAARRATRANPGEVWALGGHRLLVGDATDAGAVQRLLGETLSRVLAEAGGHWSDTVVWKKDRFVMGRADYQRQYEPIWYGWREGAKHHWCGDRDQGDVWEVERPAASEAHPTMKPLALVERALENSSRPGDVVLDLFLGSGTTLVAAERTGRVCYGMEVDQHYASVVLARWEAFTGETAQCLTSRSSS